jgi:hypothetical protein
MHVHMTSVTTVGLLLDSVTPSNQSKKPGINLICMRCGIGLPRKTLSLMSMFSPLQRAQARAVSEFWHGLHNFAFLHDGHHDGSDERTKWLPTVPTHCRHPFLAGIPDLQGGVRVMAPDV